MLSLTIISEVEGAPRKISLGHPLPDLSPNRSLTTTRYLTVGGRFDTTVVVGDRVVALRATMIKQTSESSRRVDEERSRWFEAPFYFIFFIHFKFSCCAAQILNDLTLEKVRAKELTFNLTNNNWYLVIRTLYYPPPVSPSGGGSVIN